MAHDETGCQPPEGPFLCVNNCGFFGSSATMNLCSKCYRDLLLKQIKAKAATSSTENDKNNNNIPGVVFGPAVELTGHEEIQAVVKDSAVGASSGDVGHGREQAKPKHDPNRCGSCRKRVGLTGFNCRCGNVFCSLHRYSDKHDCPFDYRAAGRDAIAKANPVVKAEKVDKI